MRIYASNAEDSRGGPHCAPFCVNLGWIGEGMEQTFHDLYRDHRGWLESWLSRRLGNGCDAADLSQDTFLRLLASSQRIADLQEPRAYLLTVGKRLLSNFYQRRSLEQAYLASPPIVREAQVLVCGAGGDPALPAGESSLAEE